MMRRVMAGAMRSRGAQMPQRRRFAGAHGHEHGHKPAGPYDLPHPAAYPDTAYAFGLSPGKGTEGWEYITLFTYVGCFAVLAFGLSAKGNSDSFTEWARREALARDLIKENGGEIVFGTYYQTAQYEEGDGVDALPKIKEQG